MTLQLPLSVQLKQDISFDTFVPGRNGETLNALRKFVLGDSNQFLYLWGPQAVGKTHLLQAACGQAQALGKGVAYLPLSQANALDAQALGKGVAYLPLSQANALDARIMQDLDRLNLNCLDDIQAICSRADWEQAVFNLFNRLRENGGRLVISADAPPSRLPIVLQDLKSRLAWGPAYRIHSLDDEDRLQLLIQSARRRGLELSRETGLYLLRRCPRDNHFLQRLLDHLDRYSMATQRRLTIPLVREALSSMASPEADKPYRV
jgi:DnaA family protein